MKKKGELVWDTLIPWIIGIAVLILVIFLYLLLSGRIENAGDFIKTILRFK